MPLLLRVDTESAHLVIWLPDRLSGVRGMPKWHISLLVQCTRGDLETQHIERCRRNCTVASFREAGADHLGYRLI